MRLYIRNSILELLSTVFEAVEYIFSHNNQEIEIVYKDCLDRWRPRVELLEMYRRLIESMKSRKLSTK